MKNRFSKIILSILMLFSIFYVVNADINPAYTEFNKHTNEEKKKSGFIPEEYVSYYDIKPSSILNYKRSFRATTDIIPSTYNLTNVNGNRLVTEVKNQGEWGLCWAFSTNSMVESYHLKKYNQYYNFSENVPGYIGKYYGDMGEISDGNTLLNAVKYWFLGNSPIGESTFGSYFTTIKDKDISDYLDSNKVEVDVQGVTFFKTLDMDNLKSKYTGTQIKNIVEDYNKTIKSHIMNNGAVTTGVFMDFYNYNTKFLYNGDESGSGSQGHAVTIVGWDDNFGSVTINGTTLKGSWIVMNSWGEDYHPYFYVSYYDADVVTNSIGTTSSKVKEWNNVYNIYTRGYFYRTNNSVVYIYDKGDYEELLDNVKLLYFWPEALDVNVTLSDGINTYDLGSKTIDKGLITFQGSDKKLTGNKLYLTLSSSNSKFSSYYPYMKGGIFTKNTKTTKDMKLVGTATNDFQNTVGNSTKYSVVTKNISTGTDYNVKVYDKANNDITSYFNVNIDNPLINGISVFNLVVNKTINSKSIKVVVTIDGLSDEVSYYIQGDGTISNPYVIAKDTDMKLLQTYTSAYFILGNDIDMNESTRTTIGSFYNSGKGWIKKNFSGFLDGNGHKISNFYSKDGGLFNYVDNATIKNLWIDNAVINSSNDSGVLGSGMSGNSVVTNVYVTNSKISNESFSGGLFSGVEGGLIKNIHLSSNEIYSPTLSGGVTAYAEALDAISIMNVFIDNTYVITTNNGVAGKLVGEIFYEGDINTLKSSNFAYNKVNTKENTSYNNAKVMIAKTTVNVTQDGETISYNPYTKDITSIENNMLTNDEIKDKNNFNNYDFTNIWGFNTKPYLKLFNNETIFEEDEIPLTISFKTYKLNNDVIYGIVPNITVQTLINNIIINDKLTYKIYNKNGSLISGSDKLATDSYIKLSNGSGYKYYYIAVYGDVNGDGKASIADVYRIADYIIVPASKKNNYLSTSAELIAANVNNDSKISIADVYKVADYVINPKIGF